MIPVLILLVSVILFRIAPSLGGSEAVRAMAGWIQAQTLGLPQYSPATWVFSARQLAGDMLFTLAFVLACRPVQVPETGGFPARA